MLQSMLVHVNSFFLFDIGLFILCEAAYNMQQPLSAEQMKPQSTSSPPPQIHQDDIDEQDEAVKQLQDCSSVYLSLQDCLVTSNRNWKACQRDVQALKACNERRKKA